MNSLATSPPEYDALESASNVLPLMCGTAGDEPDDIALVIKGTEGKSELELDFEMPSGSVSEAEAPPVSIAGVHKSCYKNAYLWAMNNEEMAGIIEQGTFDVLPGLPKGEKAVEGRWVLSLKSDKDGNITKPKARLVAKVSCNEEV